VIFYPSKKFLGYLPNLKGNFDQSFLENLLRSRELLTTDTDENAIASAHHWGGRIKGKKTPAATGIPSAL